MRKPNIFNQFIAGLVVYGLVAWFSAGYHHPDEHFQLLELANYKLKGTPVGDLPWEYRAQIRPGLQPWLAYAVMGGMSAIGLENPFQQAFLLRLISGWLAWLVFFAWARQLGRTAQDEKLTRQLLGLCLLLWFMPYLSVRFSSENWAGISFLGGLLLLTQFIDNQKYRVGRLLLGGCLLGLSFFFRFQMAFALIGLAAWLIYYRKLKFQDFALLVSGGLLAVVIGMGADFWLYHDWVPTAFNYYKANIVEHKAANWGTSPWWWYCQEIVLTGLPPLSLWLVALAIGGGVKQRKQVFVWLLVPFLLAHMVVAHKELRFIFPMVFPFLALAAYAWPDFQMKLGQRIWAKSLLILALVVNFVALPLRSITPANEAIPCLRFLYDYAQQRPVNLLAMEKSPYNLVGLTAHFYEPKGLNIHVLTELNQIDSLPGVSGNLLIYSRLQLPQPLPKTPVIRRYSYFPDWISAFNVNDWQSRSRIWSIYEVK